MISKQMNNIFSVKFKMQLDNLDNLIELLNTQDIGKQEKEKEKRKNKEQQHTGQPLSQLPPEQMNHLEDLPNFNQLYSKRMEKMEKKNQTKEEHLKKQKLMQEKIQKKMAETNQLVNIGRSDVVDKMNIRFLIFKNWGGSHFDIDLNDRGYKYRFTNGTVSLIKYTLEENGFVEGSGQQDALILWHNGVITSSIYQQMSAYQKINHFPKSFEIARKDLMLQNLSKMKHRMPREYNFFPHTFILPSQSGMFMDHAQKLKEERWYIVKPHNSSQGKGIWLSASAEQILQKQKQCIVVSEYVHKPLLANGLKFDMRIYVGITCWNPLRIYVYEDGLTRFATVPYSTDLSSKQNLFAHLTNYSLNKFNQNFEANDDQDQCKGHKWSLYALKEHLKKEGYDVPAIWTRIDDLIVKSILSIENTVFSAMEMNVPYRTNCFEVLGFDILIDEALRPWLLEINLSPSLNTDSNLDLKIKGSMIADMFTMMGVVPPDQQFSTDKTYLLNQNRMSAKQMKNQYSKLERLVLRESEEEEKRSGGWRKVFPTETAAKYKQFFDVDRPFNRLLRDEEIKKFRARNFGHAGLNQAVRNLGKKD